MYASQETRDGNIATLATQASPSELRQRFLGSTAVIDEWVEELAENLAGTSIERVPGGRTFTAGDVAKMRVREMEIHHADLGTHYTAADWSPAFVRLLLDAQAAAYAGPEGFTAHASDLDRQWTFGAGGPMISGAGTALAWWATGRGTGDGLTSDDGRVPKIEAW
jgi:maleylpyruvate isomerase